MLDKYYVRLNNKYTSLENSIAEYLDKRKKVKSLKIVLVVEKDYLLDSSFKRNFTSLLDKLSSYNIYPHNITVTMEESQRRFESSEWQKIKDAEALLSQKGVQFGFEDMAKTWSIKQVEKANSQVTVIADQIRKSNLSPYEKLLMAYLKVTSRRYASEDSDQHYSESRSVFGILNSDKIVCVGFSELLMAIMQEVGDENIQLFSNSVACSSDGKTINAFHANLIVYINDESKGINGYYYLDPTWDCAKDNSSPQSLRYFMVPLSDIGKISYQIRSDDCDLPVEKDVEDTGTDDEDEQVTYHKKRRSRVSFTKDGFEVPEEILKQILLANPKLVETLKDELFGDAYLKMIRDKDDYELELSRYQHILQMLQKAKVDSIPWASCWDDFKAKRDYSLETGEFGELEQLINEISQGTRNTNAINDLIESVHTGVEKYIAEKRTEIDDLIYKTSKEGYESWIQEEIQIQREYGEVEEGISDDELRQHIISKTSYKDYVKGDGCRFYFKEIARITRGIDEIESKLKYFDIKINKQLNNSPELKRKLMLLTKSEIEKEFKDMAYSSAFWSHEDYVKDSLDKIEHVLKQSTRESIESSINSTKRSIDICNEDLQRIQNFDIDYIVKCFMYDYCNNSYLWSDVDERCKTKQEIDNILENAFLSQSTPIDMYQMATALKKVLLITCKNKTPQEINDYIKKVIAFNCERVLSSFDEGATNSIMQYALQKKSENIDLL